MTFKEKYFSDEKEHRLPYYDKPRKHSYRCRNHGDCSYCTHNRQIDRLRGEAAAQQDVEDYLYGEE